MKELIIDYIKTYCKVSEDFVFLHDKRIYHKALETHIEKLFDLGEGSIDDILKCCLYEKNKDFDYDNFKNTINMWMPYSNINNNRTYIPEGTYNAVLRELYGGVDLANGDDSRVSILRLDSRYRELVHPDSSDDMIYTMSRAISAQTFNLNLTPLNEDLEE